LASGITDYLDYKGFDIKANGFPQAAKPRIKNYKDQVSSKNKPYQ
jgi:hypothetical protein